MTDEEKKVPCDCDPNTSPDHFEDAHDDENNGPGVTGWVNPDSITGPGVTPPKPEVGPGV